METKATGVATTRILLSIADDLENNIWLHLVHGSKKKKNNLFVSEDTCLFLRFETEIYMV